MAVTYVGVTSGNSAAGTSTSFATSLPAGWAAGDVAVLTGHVRGTSLTMSTPAGWTLVPGPTWPVAQGSNSRAYAWYRVLQAGDTAPTITLSGAMTGGWSMTAYRGADAASPTGQVGTSVISGTSLALPTLTGVLAGSALAVAVHAGVASGTIPTNITPAAAYTEVADHATSRVTTAANQRMEAAYRTIASAGSYGGESFTSDVTASMIGLMVEVTAAASTTTVTKPVATTWSTAATVIDTVAASWATAATVNAPVQTSWSTAAAASASAATRWDTSAVVVGSTPAGWSVASTVATETATGWAVASPVTAVVDTSWDVAVQVTAAVDSTWHTSGEVAAAVGAHWDTTAEVSADLPASWSVAGAALPPPTRGTVRNPPASIVRVPPSGALRTPTRSEVNLP